MPPEADVASQLLEVLREIASSIPKFFLAAAALLAALVVMRVVNKAIRWLVSVSGLEGVLREVLPEGTRVSLSTLLVVMADAAILVAASAAVINLYVPEGAPLYREALGYIARVGSVVVLSVLAVIVVDAVVKSMRLERKTERFFVMLSSLILVILVVDLAALSSEVKIALTAGLALGVGLLIGVFSIWAFFGEYIEEIAQLRRRAEAKRASELLELEEVAPE